MFFLFYSVQNEYQSYSTKYANHLDTFSEVRFEQIVWNTKRERWVPDDTEYINRMEKSAQLAGIRIIITKALINGTKKETLSWRTLYPGKACK